MTQVWDENNRVVPVTVIAAGTNIVTQVRTPSPTATTPSRSVRREVDGRKGRQAAGRPLRQGRGHPAATWSRSAPPSRRLTPSAELPVDTFAAGEEIDVTGTSKGRALPAP